jgi:putative ABC transport system permease protein
MFKYYFKAAFRNLQSNQKFFVISIAGFAFAISVCLSIFLFLAKEFSYDSYHKDNGQIVRMINVKENSSLLDYRVKDVMLRNYPEFEDACLILRVDHPIAVKVGEKGFYLDDILSVDNRFFEMFSVSFKAGTQTKPFDNISSAILTESTARTLFGTENPLGKNLMIWGKILVTITGIIKDFPDNSSISAGILVNAENEKFKFNRWMGDSRDLNTYKWPFQIYFRLNKNVNPDQLLAKINDRIDLIKPYCEEIGFLKLNDVYLNDHTTGSTTKQGNAGLLKILTGIAFIILILSVINYINLTIAQQYKRNKDAGVKKTIGADRIDIIFHFLLESLVVTLIAFILGFIIVWLLMPFYQTLFNTHLDFKLLLRFHWLIILAGTILGVGLISGSGLAIVFSGVSPARVITGSVILPGKKKYFRNALIVFQFTISVILIFCVIIVQRQVQYVKHKDAGFKKEELLKVDLPDIQPNDVQNSLAFLGELRKSPFVKNVSVTSGVPGEIRNRMGSNMENTNKNMSVPCLLADSAFLETFEIKVIKGRNLGHGDFGKVCMINEAAYKHFEFENLENKRFNNFGGYDIIGVVNDFQFTSFHESIGPLCIMFTPRQWNTAVNIRFSDNSTGPGLNLVRKAWDELLSAYPLRYQFYDDWFASMYGSEERFAKTIGLFALLAIVISCIGIFGLAIFSSERKSKEIGIRKVNGARITEIMVMLNSEFVKLVVIAFVIATPVAWYAMHKWLQNFAYKTNLSWWIFALAGLLTLGIALLTVSWQSWRAATRNPVEALRYE